MTEPMSQTTGGTFHPLSMRSIGETRERIDDQLCRRRRRLDLTASVPARRGSVWKFAGCGHRDRRPRKGGAARSANVFLMTAYRLHHEPGTVAVLEHIRANAIGRPLFFQSVFSFQTSPENHRLRATAWGGPLQDVGVYCINAARHIFAEEPIEA